MLFEAFFVIKMLLFKKFTQNKIKFVTFKNFLH